MDVQDELPKRTAAPRAKVLRDWELWGNTTGRSKRTLIPVGGGHGEESEKQETGSIHTTEERARDSETGDS